MKICYTNFHHHDGGGHTSYVLRLAQALSARHEIWIAAPSTSRLYQEAGQIPGVQRVAQQYSNGTFAMLREAAALRALIRRTGVDIVHVNGSADHRCAMVATLGTGARRPRIVLTKHHDLPADSLGNTLRARLATDRVICVSDSTRAQMESTAYRHCGLRVVRNGVDTTHYQPWRAQDSEQARRQWLGELPADAVVVGSNAGVEPHKGWMDMVHAVAGLPQALRQRVYILLAGKPFSDADRAALAALGMQDRVVHAGLLQDVRPFVAALDLGFVLSYRVETISFACREMMAMGKPVIVSDSGGLTENVSAGVQGWIVPPQTPEAVAQVLRQVLQDPAALMPLGQAARERSVAEFGLDRFVDATEQVYREVLR